MYKMRRFVLLSSMILAMVASLASADLVGHWKFDETSGDIASESSGVGNEGTFTGDPQWVEGTLGGAIELDGDDYITVPDYDALNSEHYTVAAWVNIPISQPHTYGNWVVTKGVVGGVGGYGLAVQGQQPTLYQENGTTWSRAFSGIEIELNQWHHIAATYDGTTIATYVDGVAGNTLEFGFALSDLDLLIGAWRTSSPTRIFTGIVDDVQIYDTALSEEEIKTIMKGLGDPGQASAPVPASGATDVIRDGIELQWTPGAYAMSHDVYLGIDFNDVNDATPTSPAFKLNQTETSYLPMDLDFGQTYFWRIDEVNDAPDNYVYKGKTWSFTVEPEGYPVTIVDANASSSLADAFGIENTYNRSGITVVDGVEVHDTVATHMWKSSYLPAPAYLQYSFDKVYSLHELLIWNANEYGEEFQGVGIKDVTVSTSLDGETWETLGDFVVPQGPGAEAYAANPPIALNGVVAQHVKITIHSNYSINGATPQFSVSEVQFTYRPLRARYLEPVDGAINVDPNLTLTWRSGRDAASETLSIGMDPNNLDRVVDNVASPYDTTALDLQLGETYAWNITASHPATTPSDWVGDTLSFTTKDALEVDNFDAYSDDWGNMVFQTWTDGLGWEDPDGNTGAGNDSGSAVGNWPPPTMETTIARNKQSMVFAYGLDNAADSYATREISADWSKYGVKSLALWFYGQANNTGGQLYVKVNNTRFDYAGEATDIQTAQWFAFSIDLDGVTEVDSLTIGVEGGSGTIYVDEIYLYPLASELIVPVMPDNANLMLHLPLDGNYQDVSGNNRHGMGVGEPMFVDGVLGQALELDGVDDYVNIDGYKGINADRSDPNNIVQQAFTISNWVKTLDTSNTTEMVTWGTNVGRQRLTWRIDTGRLRTEHGAGSLIGATLVNDGEWHHVALVVNEGANLRPDVTKIYVDGLEDSSAPGASAGSGNPYELLEGVDVRLGMNGPRNDRYFPGSLDDVRIYDRALSPAEVAGLSGRTAPLYKPF